MKAAFPCAVGKMRQSIFRRLSCNHCNGDLKSKGEDLNVIAAGTEETEWMMSI